MLVCKRLIVRVLFGMSDNALASGGSTPTPSLESNMRSLVDCMLTMQRQQIELVEAVRRLTPPAAVSGATQATASLSAMASVPTAVLACTSSSTTTTSSGIGELLLLINVGASGGCLQLTFIGYFLQASMLLI